MLVRFNSMVATGKFPKPSTEIRTGNLEQGTAGFKGN